MNLYEALAICVLAGFGVSFGSGFFMIPFLRKLKFGQTILDIGPSWHKKKQGTPTMGGILFILGFAVAFGGVMAADAISDSGLFISGYDRGTDNLYKKFFAGLIMSCCMAMVGFIDDYIKVVKKRNLGLTEKQKTLLQVIIIGVYLATVRLSTGTNYMRVPYISSLFENDIVFFALGFIAIYATVNSANFTDGVDGLCASVTGFQCIGFAACAAILGVKGLAIPCAALAAALLGYFMWNKNPSKVMMGDLGSLFLGGMVSTFAYTLDCPWLIIPVAFVYVMEFASDIIQIVFVRLTGRKLFLMTPIHHHYEKKGWSENRICFVFSLITVIGSVAAFALCLFGFERV